MTKYKPAASSTTPLPDGRKQPSPTFPPSTWSRDKRKLYHAIESVILDNPKLAGKILLDKIKAKLAK